MGQITDRFVVSKVHTVIDGDSFTASVDNWPHIIGHKIGVRIAEIDCPEIRGKTMKERSLAIEARRFLAGKLASASVVTIHHLRRDKYFRILASVDVDGYDLAALMIQAGYARRYLGGKRYPW